MKVKIVKINKVENGEEEGGCILEVDGVKMKFVLDGCWRCKGGWNEGGMSCIGDIDSNISEGEVVEVDEVCVYDDGEKI